MPADRAPLDGRAMGMPAQSRPLTDHEKRGTSSATDSLSILQRKQMRDRRPRHVPVFYRTFPAMFRPPADNGEQETRRRLTWCRHDGGRQIHDQARPWCFTRLHLTFPTERPQAPEVRKVVLAVVPTVKRYEIRSSEAQYVSLHILGDFSHAYICHDALKEAFGELLA